MVLRNVTATGTEASVAGSGSATITGTTQTATYSVAGSGDLLTEGYEAQRVTASVAGSGSIKCFATEFLKARTSGSGKIGYKGNPELDYPKKSLYNFKILSYDYYKKDSLTNIKRKGFREEALRCFYTMDI